MPSADTVSDLPKKGKIIKSAFDSDSFDADGSIHVDGLVGSATISPSGRDVALASPDGLAIIDLDSPYSPPRRLRSHGLPWLVVDVQWSPFAHRDYWVVSTANHRALVWNLNMREDSNSGAIEHSLQGHSRAITDINFSAHHPDQLATCSVDGYVHHWDLRRPRQPALTFCDWFAGATQVKYNRQDSHILASSHDRWLHIWDERKPGEPLKSISAHTSKIYGLDWNRTRSTGLVTCSLDKSIKFWDYEKGTVEPEQVYRTDYPVWRARHTPFGWGLLAMPQNAPGDLYLYDRRTPEGVEVDRAQEPAVVFSGHGSHKAKEFLWRTRGGISQDGADERDFQLVSWGSDNELRLHCVDSEMLTSVGHRKGAAARKGMKLTRLGAHYKTFRNVEETTNWERRMGTMSDSRTGNINQHGGKSALSVVLRSGPSQNRSTGPVWRGPSMKAKNTFSAKSGDRVQSQLGWMKGISMVKRHASRLDGPRRRTSKDSAGFAHGYPDDRWGEPDTIEDELVRIGHTIPKVKWDNFDMDSLTFHASLNGSWGPNGETIFIKVRIDVPPTYPKLKAPTFTIEKTTFMPEETHERLQREIHQLANQFLQRQENCLEVAFTYLLGEVDLETSTTFFKNVRDLDDDMRSLNDESSSEDEDTLAGISASASQELPPQSVASTSLSIASRTNIPPPPRTCGARFSPDGKLVCFFPSREEKARALFSLQTESIRDGKKGEPLFAGFGRLEGGISSSKLGADEASATEDQTDASDSDDPSSSSSSSSSDSESTSLHRLNLWYHPRRQLRKAWSEDRSVRSSGGGTGTGVGTGTGTGTQFSRRRLLGRPRNIIAMHDVQYLLPSKKELARDYAIFGDGVEVCEHNAAVAENHGYLELVDVWLYLALLLRTGIPLSMLQPNSRRDSMLVIAQHSQTPERGDFDGFLANGGLSGRVKWGEHALAHEFVSDLFSHYEQMADVQMLAMLACIFSDVLNNDPQSYLESQLPQSDKPLSLKAPSFSLDYSPTDASAWSLYRDRGAGANSASTTPGALQTPLWHHGGSHASGESTWNGNAGSNSYGFSDTPLTVNKSSSGGEATSLLSKSPVHPSGGRQFVASLSRSFTAGSSSSPPSHDKKRAAEHHNKTASGHRSVAELGDDHHAEDQLTLFATDVSVVVENQNIFDDDGWVSSSLLRQDETHLHASYRYAYAELLQLWEQPLARLEIMKFSVLAEDQSSHPADSIHHELQVTHDGASGMTARPARQSSPIVMGKKDHLFSLVASGRGLDVTGICQVHETQLEPARYHYSDSKLGGAVGTCERCHRLQSQLWCVYCLEPVDALYPPCLSCGCASHPDCLAEWHAAGETFCPAGDECECVEEALNGTVESWAALRGAMAKRGGENTEQGDDNGDTGTETGRDGCREEKSDSKAAQSKEPVASPSPSALSFGRLRKQASNWSRSSMSKG